VQDAPIAVHPAGAAQFDVVIGLLARAGLPTGDLTATSLENFLVASDAGAVVGTVAMERHDDSGLLRSLVVAPAYRGQGVGATLVDAIERRARSANVRQIALLTETAKAFFEARGYVEVSRVQVPAALQASSEFASLCPISAVCLQKNLR
jgi:amino-acid N-acetyltransferase